MRPHLVDLGDLILDDHALETVQCDPSGEVVSEGFGQLLEDGLFTALDRGLWYRHSGVPGGWGL